MTKRLISDEVINEWMKDPKYVKIYESFMNAPPDGLMDESMLVNRLVNGNALSIFNNFIAFLEMQDGANDILSTSTPVS